MDEKNTLNGEYLRYLGIYSSKKLHMFTSAPTHSRDTNTNTRVLRDLCDGDDNKR